MIESNPYQLYVSNKCSCCDKLLATLAKESIFITTVNIDTESYDLPFNLMILPALVKENKLIGYGVNDILNYIRTN